MLNWNIRGKVLRWTQAAIIDATRGQKIVEYEDAHFRKWLRGIFLALTLVGLSFGVGALYFRFTREMPQELLPFLDIGASILFTCAVFFDFLNYYSKRKKTDFRSIGVILGATLGLGAVLYFTRSNPVYSISAWIMAIALSVLLALRKYKFFFFGVLAYVGLGVFLDERFSQFQWKTQYKVFVGVMAAGAALYLLGFVLKLILALIQRIRNSKLGDLLGPIIAILKKVTEYLGPYRKWMLVAAGVLLFLSYIRATLPELDALLPEQAKVNWLWFGLFAVVVVSLLWKETPRFSILFSIAAWVEIAVQISRWQNSQIPHGRMALVIVAIVGAFICGKLYAGMKAPIPKFMPLGPVGYFSLGALILIF